MILLIWSGRSVGAALISLCLNVVAARVGWAEIYRYVDEHGQVHFSDRRLGPGYQLIQGAHQAKIHSAVRDRAQTRSRLNALIREAAMQNRLEPALIHAVITAESAYNPDAVSRAGAVGLMQLMPGTASRYGVQARDRQDPAQNIRAGVRYLRDLLERFQSLPLAIAAYNAGEEAVVEYGHRIPPYPETQAYVRKVLNYYRAYQLAS